MYLLVELRFLLVIAARKLYACCEVDVNNENSVSPKNPVV